MFNFGPDSRGACDWQLPDGQFSTITLDGLTIGTNTAGKLFEALSAAGQKPEAHAFVSGGNGWGLKKQGLSSDHWIDNFYYWLETQGFTKKAAAK